MEKQQRAKEQRKKEVYGRNKLGSTVQHRKERKKMRKATKKHLNLHLNP